MSKSPSTSGKFIGGKARAGKLAPRRKSNSATEPPSASLVEQHGSGIEDDLRRNMIAEAAYYRAERRSFAPGFELEDWLLSEIELDASAPAQIQRQRLARSTSSSAELH